MRHNLKELQQQYWQESCRLMQPQWELLNNLTTIQWKQSHLLQLRFLLQQTVLNLLFVKIGIIPSIHHLSYLKRLLTWYAPEVSSNIKLTTAIESVLFASRNDTCVFPQLQYPIEELHTDIVHEAYTFCKDIFDFTNTLYTSTNSSQTTHP